MNLRKTLKKLVYPIYNKSKFIRYHITSLRMNLDNKNLKEQRLNFYSNFIKQGDLCFDIGANYGNRTDIFLNVGAKVIAVEPQDLCVEYLKRKYKNKIAIEQKGVGAEPGIKDFYVCDASVLSTFSEEFKDKDNGVWNSGDYKLKDVQQIEIITLDSLIDKYGLPDFIKIDVEGFEPEVMKGLSQKVKMLSFEYCVADSGINLNKCINRLTQISDHIEFNFSIGESMELFSKDWYNTGTFMDIIQSEKFMSSDFGDIYVRFI